jgi:hypothetical protein
MTPTLTREDLEQLKAPFDASTISIKIQSFSKAKDRAMLVAYVQHTDAYNRLESVDPGWTCETTNIKEVGDLVVVSMKMTVKGVTRENVGEGEDYKSAYSDALKRVAMLFGIGRYLYDQGQAWVKYDDQKDRFRVWTLSDYQSALRGEKLPTASAPAAPLKSVAPAAAPKATSKADLSKAIFATAKQLNLSPPELAKWAQDDFKKAPTELTVAEMGTFLATLQHELGRAGESA